MMYDVYWYCQMKKNEWLWKKVGVVEKMGEEETKYMPYAPVYKMEKLETICSDWARKSLW